MSINAIRNVNNSYSTPKNEVAFKGGFSKTMRKMMPKSESHEFIDGKVSKLFHFMERGLKSISYTDVKTNQTKKLEGFVEGRKVLTINNGKNGKKEVLYHKRDGSTILV